MHFIRLFNRVWVRGRDGEYTILRIDHPEHVVDLCPPPGGAAIETNVPFNVLSASPTFDRAHSDSSVEDWREMTHSVLRSSAKSMHASSIAIAELRQQLRTTMAIIQATQRRIVQSDELVVRAGFAGPLGKIDETESP